MIQRGGEAVIRMLANVQQTTIKPLIEATIAPGSLIYTDEYGISTALPNWGYEHKTVCHGQGEYARDEDGDGFCEVHVNTIEGFWSLLRSWLRPHRGISQEKLPLYFLTGFLVQMQNGDYGRFARPCGIAVAQDGSLLVGDDMNGDIYRVSYSNSNPGKNLP